MWTRRKLLLTAQASAASALFPGAGFALANAPTDRRLVILIQRGAQDGLHAVPPYADKDYRSLRPNLAVPKPGDENGALDLDGYFGLHPALTTLQNLYKENELAVIPAIATRYRERSHFEAQNLLENGSSAPYGADDGWLNRALTGLGGPNAKLGFAFGFTVPLILRGDAAVATYAPSTLPAVDDDFLNRLLSSYEDDVIFAEALAEGMSPLVDNPMMDSRETRRASRGKDVVLAAKSAATALAAEDGPRVAVIESNGWDTHSGQAFRLNRLFGELDGVFAALKEGLNNVWTETIILTISEFGRTARQNGSNGTDHGTGGISFIGGGAVNGGKIAGEWPGLSARALYEDRDVAPANALEGVLKALLTEHLGASEAHIEDSVFPGSRNILPFSDLVRSHL